MRKHRDAVNTDAKCGVPTGAHSLERGTGAPSEGRQARRSAARPLPPDMTCPGPQSLPLRLHESYTISPLSNVNATCRGCLPSFHDANRFPPPASFRSLQERIEARTLSPIEQSLLFLPCFCLLDVPGDTASAVGIRIGKSLILAEHEA